MEGDTTANLMPKVNGAVECNKTIIADIRRVSGEVKVYRALQLQPAQLTLSEEPRTETAADHVLKWRWSSCLKPMEPLFVKPAIDFSKRGYSLAELEDLNTAFLELAKQYAQFGEHPIATAGVRQSLDNLAIVQTALGQLHEQLLPAQTRRAHIERLIAEVNRGLEQLAANGVILRDGQVGQRGSGDGEFSNPRHLAIDRNGGRVLVADYSNARVVVFDRDLRFSRTISMQGAHPWGVAVSSDGQLYVTINNLHKVQVYDTESGTLVREWGQNGTAPGQLSGPQGIAVHRSTGNVIVADTSSHRVQVFDDQGNFVRAIGASGSGSGNFSGPTGIAVDEQQNRIIVSDSGNHRIQIFTMGGAFVRSVGSRGNQPGQFNGVQGVAVNEQGDILVSDVNNQRVQMFDKEGRLLRVVPTQCTPWGLSCREGSPCLLITDSVFHCIRSIMY